MAYYTHREARDMRLAAERQALATLNLATCQGCAFQCGNPHLVTETCEVCGH